MIRRYCQHGALAQRIESQTSNLQVGGSSPSCLTKRGHQLKGCPLLVRHEGLEAERARTWGESPVDFRAVSGPSPLNERVKDGGRGCGRKVPHAK